MFFLHSLQNTRLPRLLLLSFYISYIHALFCSSVAQHLCVGLYSICQYFFLIFSCSVHANTLRSPESWISSLFFNLYRDGWPLLYFQHDCWTSISWTWACLSVHVTWRSRSRVKKISAVNEAGWADFRQEKIGGPNKNSIKIYFPSTAGDGGGFLLRE